MIESYSPEKIDAQRAGEWSEASLSPERISQLVEGLIPSEDVRQGRQMGLHVVEGDQAASDIARYVEWTVFEEFFKNDIQVMREEYSKYDQASTFLLVLDYEQKKPVGVIRLIKPSEAGLKSLNDLISPTGPWNVDGHTAEDRLLEIGDQPDNTVDIATMGVMPEYRTNHAADGASAALYSTCVWWSLENGYNQWITVVDQKIYDMMQSWGEPFKKFDGADWAPYLDSPKSLPVHTELFSGLERIRQFDIEMSRQTGQEIDIHGLYTKGKGLEGQFVLPVFGSEVQ